MILCHGDKDLIQLTDELQWSRFPRKVRAEFGKLWPDYLMEKWPHTSSLIDLKVLMGDKSDNIPGVTKLVKRWHQALLEHGSLEGIYENIDGMKASKTAENPINDKEQAQNTGNYRY